MNKPLCTNNLLDSSVGIADRTADTGIAGSNPTQGAPSFFFIDFFQKNVSFPTNLHFFQKSFKCFLVSITPSITYQKERTTFLKMITLIQCLLLYQDAIFSSHVRERRQTISPLQYSLVLHLKIFCHHHRKSLIKILVS